jgi:hypothetical protein
MIRLFATTAIVLGLVVPAAADDMPREDSILVRAMRAELERSKTLALEGMETPYYIGYRVVEVEEVEVLAEFGGIVTNSHDHSRWASVEMRIGDRDFDNTNFDMVGTGSYPTQLTVDDDHDVLRHQLWIATDWAYKSAVDAIENKRAALTNHNVVETVPDFSLEKVTKTVVDAPAPSIDAAPYVALAKKLSTILRDFPIHEGGVQVRAYTVQRYFLDSDGMFSYEPDTLVDIWVAARAQADDGMNLMNYDRLVVGSADDLPADAELEKMVRTVATELIDLTKAPTMDDYIGPVLFEGDAAAQLMPHLVAANMAGTPAPKDPDLATLPPDMLAQMGLSAFSSKLGKRILPTDISISDDPNATKSNGVALVGNYTVDDEGIPAQKVSLVEKGKLVGFLMSRTPSKKFPNSNGHARGGLSGVRARVGNLFIKGGRGLSAKKMRAQLTKTAKKAGEPYGIVIRRLDNIDVTVNYAGQSGFLAPMNGGPPAPLIAYKVYANGKEELVRGVGFESFAIRSLRGITHTGSDTVVFNTAEGGFGFSSAAAYTIPTSIITPTLLFGDLDLIGAKGPQTKPPILTRP